MTQPPLFFLIAGEPSGDALGAPLMAALRERTEGKLAFAGVGGPRMIEQGLRSLFPMSELSVMGLAEILPRVRHYLRRMSQTAEEIRRLRPAALITIDAPGFTLRVTPRVRGLGIPCIHYVAPSVWAWRPGRAKKTARLVDHLLALLPFEPPYFEREGLPCTFVGHPAVESGAGRGDAAAFRARHGLGADRRIVIMLPGSRRGEVNRLLGPFTEALRLLQAGRPDFTVVVPVASGTTEIVREGLVGAGLDILVVEGDREKFDAFAAAEVALAKSGTVTLELALAGLPTVIGYILNPVSHAILDRIKVGRFAGLPNVVLDRELMPELLQQACQPPALAAELAKLLDNPAARAAQIAGMARVGEMLSVPGSRPSLAAADAVLRVVAEKALAGGDAPQPA
jgi:lipid-A-disaccharide synthase